jgi:valyl-tRNA synthetase
LELIKPILNGPDDQNKAETVMTAGAVLGQILDMLNPFMPFITEELHDRLSVSDQPLITKRYEDMPVRDEAACADINWIMEMVTTIRQLRSEMNIDPSDKVAVMVKPQDDDARHRVNTYRLSIKQMANLAELTLVEEISADMASGAVQDVVQGSTLILPLADVIDFEAEKERLIKQMADLDDDLQLIERKLANDDFVTQAPDAIVEKERRKKREALKAKSKIEQALSTLKQAFGKA